MACPITSYGESPPHEQHEYIKIFLLHEGLRGCISDPDGKTGKRSGGLLALKGIRLRIKRNIERFLQK